MWDKNQIAAAGIKGDWVLALPDFVKYGDLDAYNHVNNKVYHAWFENLRVIYFREMGLVGGMDAPYKTVVRSASIDFYAQMIMGEDYVTTMRCSRVGNSSFDLDYAVYVDGEMRTTGKTLMVLVDITATKSVRIPEDIREILITRDGANS